MKKETYNTLTEITENHYYIENDNWKCQLDDKEVKLGLYIEVYDLREFDENINDDDTCPYSIQVSIVVANPSENHRETDDNDRLGLIYDCHSYRGGVPFNDNSMEFKGEFKLGEAHIRTYENRFTKTKEQYLTYSDDNIDKAMELMLKGISPQMMLIGFILDKSINLIGDTGWKIIKESIDY